MSKKSSKVPAKVANYYSKVPLTHKKVILEMRFRILKIAPNSEEIISYGMPAFKLNGHVIAGLLANKNHIGYYPFSGNVLHLFKKELKDFHKTKSAIHVPLDKPLSSSLLKKLLQARISQCPVKRGEVNLEKYSNKDKAWREIGISAPARRGLIDLGLTSIRDLRRVTESELNDIHGVGPSASKLILKSMKANGIKFKKSIRP